MTKTTNCEICGQRKRPLVRAIQEYRKDKLNYDMEVWACLDCLEINIKDVVKVDIMIGELEFITDGDGFVIDVIVPEHMKDRVVFAKNSNGKVIWLKVYDIGNFTWGDLK